jgi:glycosyltransferase involved in cell wall biosynthesis
MRIAYVCADRGIPVLGDKGASVHVRELTKALALRGHRVHLRCARLGEENRPPRVASIEECDSATRLERSLEGLFERPGIDVVLERYSLESGRARQASTSAGVPLVLEVNAPLVLEAARWRGLTDVDSHLTAEREVFASADSVIVVSSALAEYVATRAPGVAIRRAPNGADVETIARAVPARLGVAEETIVIGFTGSMKPWHGVNQLLDAFSAVRVHNPRVMLVLAGGGPEEARLRDRVAVDPIVRDSVRFLGALPHDAIPSLLASFDIGVAPYLPSDDFYFSPLKVVEYLAARLPVVFPRLGDLPELVGDAGIPYEPGRSDGLTHALETAVAHPALRARLSQAAGRRAAVLSWDATATAVEQVLDEAVATVRAGTAS